MDQQWTEAAGRIGKRIAPQYRIERVEKQRPIFVAETDWPWVDGTYWRVTNGQQVAAKLFSDRFEAERLRDQLNKEKRAPKRARSLSAETELTLGRPDRVAKSKPNPDKSSKYNRGLTVRPKPGVLKIPH